MAAGSVLGVFGAISLVMPGARTITGAFSGYSGPAYALSIAGRALRNLLLIAAGTSTGHLPAVAASAVWFSVLVYFISGIYMAKRIHGSVAAANFEPTFFVASAARASAAVIVTFGGAQGDRKSA